MAKIIAIDTALSACSVALSNEGQVSVLRESRPRQHIQLILPMIDELLKQSGLSVLDINAIGFSQGPGSFTGLRIGMGVVQGLAFGANLQVMPISTLHSIAQMAIDKKLLDDEELVIPMIDARMNEVYWGVYKNTNGLAQPLCVDMLNSPEQVEMKSVRKSARHFAAKGLAGDASMVNQSPSGQAAGKQGLDQRGSVYGQAYQIALDNIAIGVGDGWQFGERISLRPAVIDQQLISDAEQVLTLALQDFKCGRCISVEQVEPLYLRNKMSWTKRQRLRKKDN